MKKLMKVLMLSCEKAPGLIEKKSIFSLNQLEKIQLFLHTSMCDACKSYQKQSNELDTLIEGHIHTKHQSPDTSTPALSDDFKKQIIKKLEESK